MLIYVTMYGDISTCIANVWTCAPLEAVLLNVEVYMHIYMAHVHVSSACTGTCMHMNMYNYTYLLHVQNKDRDNPWIDLCFDYAKI